MREGAAAIALMVVLLGICAKVDAQRRPSREVTLAKVTQVTSAAAAGSGGESEAALVLRPAPGTELLASRVARVLALRFGQHSVRVGGPPPPGLLEAVPAGHLALAREDERVRLVLGAAFGAFFEASVPLATIATPASEPDVRSLALAVEALRDRVFEATERTHDSARADAPLQPTAAQPSPAVAARSGTPPRDRGATPSPASEGEAPREVKPTLYVRMYTGASNESSGLRMGLATGGGLCVQGHCLVIGFESPLPGVLEASATDVRYRYPTITSSFYTRPWQFGVFAPALSIGFLSRVGYFDRDMGVEQADSGLDTDLGVRSTLEGSFALGGAFELTSEFGMDYALDRWQLGRGESVRQRGERATVWGQAGLRVRPY